MHIGEPELRQACKRYFRKLIRGCVLLPLKGGGYAVSRSGGVAEKARLRMDATLAEAFLARGDLQMSKGGALELSAAGRAHYIALTDPDANPCGTQHQELVRSEIRDPAGRRESVSVNIRESPLSYLHQRRLISRTQFDAGERLRRDFTSARLSPRLGMDWSRPIRGDRRSGAADNLSDIVLDAKDRFRKALMAVGPEFSGLLYDICCDLNGLEAVEKRMGWPRSSAKVVLRLGLDRLARHYGLDIPRCHAGISAWAAPTDTKQTEKGKW